MTKERSVLETEIRSEMMCCDEQLEGVLKKGDWDLLEKYRNLTLSLCKECEYQAFKIGYSFGIKMIINAMQ